MSRLVDELKTWGFPLSLEDVIKGTRTDSKSFKKIKEEKKVTFKEQSFIHFYNIHIDIEIYR